MDKFIIGELYTLKRDNDIYICSYNLRYGVNYLAVEDDILQMSDGNPEGGWLADDFGAPLGVHGYLHLGGGHFNLAKTIHIGGE